MNKIIGIDIRDLRIAKTGARTYLNELINAFQAHPNKSFTYVLIDTNLTVYTGSNKFFKLIEHFKFFYWKQIVLPIKAKIKGCQILICTDYFVPYFSFGIKTLPVFHDAFFYEYPNHYNKFWLFLFKSLAVSAAKKSYLVITPTNYTKKQIVKYSSIPNSKIEVIYEAAKTLTSTSKTPIQLVNESLAKHSYVLHVGTMEKRKNIPRLLKSFKKLKVRFPSLKLVLIGQFSPKSDMSDKSEILQCIEESKLNEDVIFPGYISDEDLSIYYMNALAYVFPSVNEGFGIPILEAFSKDLPVIAANNTCMQEIGANAAIYFDPYDIDDMTEKIEQVISNQELMERMTLDGRERLNYFSWSKTADHFVGLFDRILSSS